MKTILKIMIFTLIGSIAQAHAELGSSCGLLDFADDLELQNEKSISLTLKSKLTSLQKKQIIVAAELDEGTSFKDSLKSLIEGSESGDVYYQTGSYNGQDYEIVRHYPGGNPYGTIFKKGQSAPHAFISDSDITCAE